MVTHTRTHAHSTQAYIHTSTCAGDSDEKGECQKGTYGGCVSTKSKHGSTPDDGVNNRTADRYGTKKAGVSLPFNSSMAS
jgi:hypothetical protein